ncbi:MAG: TetR/AcrR family transcriptional regulator [Novosphingobium sp.]
MSTTTIGSNRKQAGERKPESGRPARKTRADRERNRQRLIEAAKAAFAEEGAQVSLDAIARRAGVGIGTLYRHFPSRDAIIEAICRREVTQLAEAAPKLLSSMSPADALQQWMRLFVDYIATKQLLSAAIYYIFGIAPEHFRNSAARITDSPVMGTTTELWHSSTAQLIEAAVLLLKEGIKAGEIRADIEPMDLLRAISGFTVTYGNDVEGWEASALRLIEIFMDGLRTPKNES